jgi:hypothetical protein
MEDDPGAALRQEVHMNWNQRLRQIHRWLSVVFTVAVLINIVAMVRGQQATWIGLLALFPLIVLMITGLYMFIQPYLARGRGQRREERQLA